MKQTVYINGEFALKNKAKMSIFDRGFLFADTTYEVCAIPNGKLVDNEAHIQHLHRSLNARDMTSPSPDKKTKHYD